MLVAMPRRVLLVALVAFALLSTGAATNDPLVASQYHLQTVRAFDAWQASRGQGIVVAVVDTGVTATHPDLQGRIVGGVDLIEPGTPPDDDNGHGTLVAGVIAANAGNGVGVAGAAPDSFIMPVRVLDAGGGGVAEDVAEGIRWAADHGAQVINLSLAEAPGQSPDIGALINSDVEQAIRDASLRGVLVVAAAGNEGRAGSPYGRDVPALVVGATDRDDRIWAYSNRDDQTLFAPGVEMVSTYSYGSGYAKADGTSFATALVAAGGALLRARGLEANAVRARLVQTSTPIGTGLGRVDLAAAVGVAAWGPAPAPTLEPSPSAAQRGAGASGPPSVLPAPAGSAVPSSPTPAPPPPPSPPAPSDAATDRAVAPGEPGGQALASPAGERDVSGSSRWPVAVATALLIANLAALQAYAAHRPRQR